MVTDVTWGCWEVSLVRFSLMTGPLRRVYRNYLNTVHGVATDKNVDNDQPSLSVYNLRRPSEVSLDVLAT